MMQPVETAVDKNTLEKVAKAIASYLRVKNFRKIEKLIGDRKRMFFENDAMD